MDTTHLQSTDTLLLNYLIEKGYKDDSLWIATASALHSPLKRGVNRQSVLYRRLLSLCRASVWLSTWGTSLQKLKSYIRLLGTSTLMEIPSGVVAGFMAGPSRMNIALIGCKEIIDNHYVMRRAEEEGRTNPFTPNIVRAELLSIYARTMGQMR